MSNHPSNEVTMDNVDDVFTYQNDSARIPAYQAIREKAKEMAIVILENTPKCADRATSMRHLRQSVMNANAAIALAPVWPPEK